MSQAVANRLGTLKAQLASLGLTRPGSLVERYMPCGKPGCRCMGDPPALHGPYYQWTHKVRGTTVTKRLSKAQAELSFRTSRTRYLGNYDYSIGS